MKKDLKEALGSARKPDITHVRKSLMVYIARACEYGSEKYERANYVRPVGGTGETPAADLWRYRSYLRAAVSHFVDILDVLEHLEAEHPGFEGVSWEVAQDATYAIDTDVKPGSSYGPSRLPHIAHGAASVMMAIEQAVAWGLLPDDPGDAWNHGSEPFRRDMCTVEDDFDQAWYRGPHKER